MNASCRPAVVLMIVCGFCALAACDRNTEGDPVDYGPAVTVDSLKDAIDNMVRDSNVTQTKVGAFGRFLTTAEIGGGSMSLLLANTSHEVTSRTLENGILTLNIHETSTEYRNGAPTNEKMSRNFPLSFRISATPAPLSELQLMADLEPAIAAPTDGSTPTPTPAPTPKSATYHRLRTWEDTAPAPARVQAQPNCLGIPGCRIRLRHVTFNIVWWDDPKGTLLRVELVTSPDVPQSLGFNMNPLVRYLPGLMKSCITRTMQIGNDTRNRTLVNECKTVVNFAYDSATP